MVSSCTFAIIFDTGTVTLGTPNSISYNDSRSIVRFNFWTGSSYTGDVCKAAESITMNGVESTNTDIYNMDTYIDNEDTEVTIAGFNDTLLDTTWVIRNLSFMRDRYNTYSWSLTLEKK